MRDLTDYQAASRYRRMRQHDLFWYFAVGIVVLVVAVFGWLIFRAYTATHHRTVVVTGKERVCKSTNKGDHCDYLLFTDGGTFKVGDSIVAFRFNSSDVYGEIAPCHRYDLSYYGWRFGLTSTYPNVIEAHDLGRVEGCEPR